MSGSGHLHSTACMALRGQQAAASTSGTGLHCGLAVFHARGDILRATAIAHQLRAYRPDATIVWHTSRVGAEILANNPHVDRVVCHDEDPWCSIGTCRI